MGRYKQAGEHHLGEFKRDLPIWLAKRWYDDNIDLVTVELEKVLADGQLVDDMLLWTDSSLALDQVAEYLVYRVLPAVDQIIRELQISHFLGRDLFNVLDDHFGIGEYGVGKPYNDGDQRAQKFPDKTRDWCGAIASELIDIIAEDLLSPRNEKGFRNGRKVGPPNEYAKQISALRKRANQVKAVTTVHNS